MYLDVTEAYRTALMPFVPTKKLRFMAVSERYKFNLIKLKFKVFFNIAV